MAIIGFTDQLVNLSIRQIFYGKRLSGKNMYDQRCSDPIQAFKVRSRNEIRVLGVGA